MKRTLVLILGGLLLTPALAEQVDMRLSTRIRRQCRDLQHGRFNFTVRGWSRDSVQVTGELGDDVEELVLERDGDYVLVKVKVPRTSWPRYR